MAASGKTNPMPLRHRFVRRFVQLQVGLLVYGVSLALLVRAHLGLDPWDVFQQGISRHTGLSFGTVVCAVGALVLLLWIPLRQRPGLGTISNVVVIGAVADLALRVVPDAEAWWLRGALMVAGVVLNAAATGLYIGARLGPGPRDGLMTGLSQRFGWLSVRVARTSIEVTVLAAGFLLGGSIGVATVLYAFGIGPLTQLFLPLFSIRDPRSAPPATAAAALA
ncbi:YitT family protein [Dactylosporangium cerinum]|uniref:YitT family protein n=1 Tax=Dactylosporangium cerinum TaxID=1434730 RepID=A0ABV9VV82_9ACTN